MEKSAGNLGRIHGSCSEKPILRWLQGSKVSAHTYWACIPTKHGKFEIIIGKQTKNIENKLKPSRNSIYHLINEIYNK